VSSIKVFTNVGEGIKNPTFDELFGGDFADGNPDLHPERARTFDVGTEVTFSDQRWLGRVAFFDNRYRDQVAFVSSSFLGPDGIADFINVNGSKASGVELGLYLQRPLRGVTASATYALVETEVTENVSSSVQFQVGQPLLRRPKHSGAVQLAYSNGPVTINVDVRRVGERHDSAFLFLSTLDFASTDITVNPAYTLLGLGGSLRVRDDLTLFLRLGNLTDAAYQSALGFPGLPRALVVGGRFRVGRRQN
jgi:vitamin B12 transporter